MQSFNTLEEIFGNNPYLYNFLVLAGASSWRSIISMQSYNYFYSYSKRGK